MSDFDRSGSTRTVLLAFAAGCGIAAVATAGVVALAATAVLAPRRAMPTVPSEPPAVARAAPPIPRFDPVPVAPAVPVAVPLPDLFAAPPVEPPAEKPVEPLPTPAAVKPVAPPPARDARLEPGAARRFAVGDELEQAVTVTRRSATAVAGATVTQAARYTITSRLTVTADRPDGGSAVRQVVESARLADADDLLRPALADALKKSEGVAFEMAVGPDGAVTGFRGPADPIRVLEGADAGGNPSVRLWSVLDADAWRELAELTFFVPGAAAKAGGTRVRPVSHDWGPLGGWTGKTTFTGKGRIDGADRIDFRHALTYRPPPPGADGDLPVRLIQPRFAVVSAGGAVRYDAGAGRVTAAEETFRVRGAATVVFAGQLVGVEMEEAQVFEVRVGKPPGQVLIARPRGR